MMKIPLYPEYGEVSALMRILDGNSVMQLKTMWSAIMGLTGTPQNPVDWSDPDVWIPTRLSGEAQQTAWAIWKGSAGRVNPRRCYGAQLLMTGYELIGETNGVWELTADGKTFIAGGDNPVARRIDMEEGLMQILRQLSVLGRGKRSDLLGEWRTFTADHSNLRQESVVKEYLRRRLANLVDRGYVGREGNVYVITEAGTAYLQSADQSNPNAILSEETELRRLIEEFNGKQKLLLREFLAKTTPYRFEYVVRDLLSSMGYEDVEVTSPTNDKGVDVVGTGQNGITTVREVIQVKRHTSGNVTRPVLDKLRGSLHRFDAFQGTIITLSDFAKGARNAAFEKGAAPITLINGDKLLELLTINGVGITRKTIDFYVVDESYFEHADEE